MSRAIQIISRNQLILRDFGLRGLVPASGLPVRSRHLTVSREGVQIDEKGWLSAAGTAKLIPDSGHLAEAGRVRAGACTGHGRASRGEGQRMDQFVPTHACEITLFDFAERMKREQQRRLKAVA